MKKTVIGIGVLILVVGLIVMMLSSVSLPQATTEPYDVPKSSSISNDDLRWHEILKHAYGEAIEESKPTYEDLKWKMVVREANQLFEIPRGKIYEVMVYTTINSGISICMGAFFEGGTVELFDNTVNPKVAWFPQKGQTTYGRSYFAPFDNIDPATGNVTYQGNPIEHNVTEFYNYDVMYLPEHGWILTEDDSFYPVTAACWVRYRDVTKLSCRT